MTTAGRSCAAPVSLLDIYPTLNELCSLDQKLPQALSGRSLVPLLQNTEQEWPFVAITSHDVGNVAVTDTRYHYIRYAHGAEELYDHEADPREYNNLAQQLAFKPVTARLSTHLPQSWVPAPRKKVRKTGAE